MNGEMSKKSTTPFPLTSPNKTLEATTSVLSIEQYWAKAGTTIRSTQVGRTTSDPLSIKNRI